MSALADIYETRCLGAAIWLLRNVLPSWHAHLRILTLRGMKRVCYIFKYSTI
jgi:hypothetical protein